MPARRASADGRSGRIVWTAMLAGIRYAGRRSGHGMNDIAQAIYGEEESR